DPGGGRPLAGADELIPSMDRRQPPRGAHQAPRLQEPDERHDPKPPHAVHHVQEPELHVVPAGPGMSPHAGSWRGYPPLPDAISGPPGHEPIPTVLDMHPRPPPR